MRARTAPDAGRALIEAVREGLRAAADPAKAPQMQAYMKSSMPFHGVQSPQQRRIFRAAVAAYPLEGFEAWRDTVLALWREATHREEWYAAIALAEARAYSAHRTREAMPVYEEMILTGAWWDVVDPIASHLVGELLERDREWTANLMHDWSRDQHLWKRRTSIICQLGAKEDTDLDLLYDCIEPNIGDGDFFIRKAIGWALRQYAWTQPDEVVRYVEANAERLSPLSRREALKNVGRIRGQATSASRRAGRSEA
jgi:3-methyladenine DNA glycosylase AlkD